MKSGRIGKEKLKWKEVGGTKGFYRISGEGLTEVIFRADSEEEVRDTLEKLQLHLLMELEMRLNRKRKKSLRGQSQETTSERNGTPEGIKERRWNEEDLFRGLAHLPVLGGTGSVLRGKNEGKTRSQAPESRKAGVA